MTASSLLAALVVVTCAALLPFSAAQTSCSGRCGDPFARGQPCQCDASCLTHDECCKDFEALCIFGESCSGRCGESFRRGRLCECDPGCVRYDTCCRDYQNHCAKALGLKTPKDPITLANIAKALGLKDPSTLADIAKALGFNNPNDLNPPQNPSYLADIAKALGLNSPNDPITLANIARALGLNDPNKPITLADIAKALGLNDSSTLADIAKPLGVKNPNKPITLADIAKVLGFKNPNDPKTPGNPNTLADVATAMGLNDPYKPITVADIATTLGINDPSNFFWTIDPITKDHGPARNITEELGIPSPIDSAFTRTNCQGKSYIIKGDDYWRMDNGNIEPGYPKSVASGFHGLTGTITAALPVPATRRRPESVYFFKKGGTMQKYSYPAGSSTVCGKKSKSSAKKRHARQTEMSLGAEINIKLALKGFPSSVTSAVSVPSSKKADGYDYFLFAGPLYFNIKISGDLPALAKPDNADPRQNSIKKWLKCI
uniref:Proteoglycan 4a n=1 Tax=Hucho hucho TaxID=62062 RepID=A0A4W5MM10_9TELE